MPGTPDYRFGQPHVPESAIDLSPALRSRKYCFIDRPSIQPVILNYGVEGARTSVPTLPVAGDAQNTIGVIDFGGGLAVPIEMYHSTAQALKPLLHATKGIEIALDQVNNETVEYVPGGNNASNPLGYLAGTDPGVFIRATFEITANNGLDQFGVGFRKQEAYQVPTSFLTTGDPLYTDIVLFGFAGVVASPNQVRVSSDAANGGSATVFATNFFWSSGQVHTLEVRVKGRKVSYFINGASLGSKISKDGLGAAITGQQTAAPPDYTFASALQLIPYIFLRQDAVTSTVFLRRLVCGQLVEDGLDPANRQPFLL